MDEKLKQRIVGVVVITALLAIFLPMLFEDPVERSGRSISEIEIPDLPEQYQDRQQVKIPASVDDVLQQEITLKPEIKARPEPIVAEAKPEAVAPVVKPVAESQQTQASESTAENNAIASEPEVSETKPEPEVSATKPELEVSVTKPEPESGADQLLRWVIQVGSFKSKENAETESIKLRKQGFPAFVEPYNDMYRVRVGPMLNKQQAEQKQQLLETKNNIKSLLVSE